MLLVPSEAWVEGVGGCEFEMEDAAAIRAYAAFRRVEDERGHEQDVARLAFAGVCAVSGQRGDGFRGQAAVKMGTRDDAERAVVRIGGIEVYPHGDHLFKQLHRGLHVGNAVLHAPWAVAFARGLRGRADGEILMPRDGPVFRRGFVK